MPLRQRKPFYQIPHSMQGSTSRPAEANRSRRFTMKVVDGHLFSPEIPQLANGFCRFQAGRAYTVPTREKRSLYLSTDQTTDLTGSIVNRDRFIIENTRTASTDFRINEIVFASPSKLRFRKVVTRARSRSTGKYPSWKMGRMIQWESFNELNAFRLLDCDPEVRSFGEQPCEIRYIHDGVAKRHVPDILVERSGRKELWEVKPEAEAFRPDIASRTALLTELLPKWGYDYHLILGSDLAKQPRMRNADRLLRFGREGVTDGEREFVRLTLKRPGALTWSDACAGAYGSRGRKILCRLTLDGTLSFDMNAPWSPDTCFVAGKRGI